MQGYTQFNFSTILFVYYTFYLDSLVVHVTLSVQIESSKSSIRIYCNIFYTYSIKKAKIHLILSIASCDFH